MGDDTTRTSTRLREAAAVTLVLLAAAGIRLISLPNEAVWHDEIATLEFLDAPSLIEFLKQAHAVTPAPPLYSITQYCWSRLFGDSVLALRLLSLGYGLAGLTALYGLGRALFGHRAALIAAAWMSLVFWHIYHSQEIRFYGMVTLLALLCVSTFVRFVARPAPATLALHALVSAAMIWTQPQSVLLFGALGLFLLIFRWTSIENRVPRLSGVQLRRVPSTPLISWTAVHLALAGTLVAFLASIDRDLAYAQAGWLPLPTIRGSYPSVAGFLAMGSGLMEFPPVNRTGVALLPWRDVLWYAIEFVTIAGLFTAAALHFRKPAAPSPRIGLTSREVGALLLLWFIVPPLLAYVGSFAWRPTFLGRYLAFSFPALYLALGYLLQHRPRWLVSAAFVPLFAFDALFYFPGPMRTPYDRIVATIQSESVPDLALYTDDMIAVSPIGYYWNGPPPEVRSPLDMERAVNALDEAVHFDAASNWLLLTDPKRADYMRLDLRRAGADFDLHYFPSLRPAWLFYVSGPFQTIPPQPGQ